MFVEKPLSVRPPEEVQRLSERLSELQKQKQLIIAVGYMLRYSPAVEVGVCVRVHHWRACVYVRMCVRACA